jgi:hypothetical protein
LAAIAKLQHGSPKDDPPNQNARVAVCSRELIAARIGTGQGAAEVAAAYGFSARTARKRVARFKAGGWALQLRPNPPGSAREKPTAMSGDRLPRELGVSAVGFLVGDGHMGDPIGTGHGSGSLQNGFRGRDGLRGVGDILAAALGEIRTAAAALAAELFDRSPHDIHRRHAVGQVRRDARRDRRLAAGIGDQQHGARGHPILVRVDQPGKVLAVHTRKRLRKEGDAVDLHRLGRGRTAPAHRQLLAQLRDLVFQPLAIVLERLDPLQHLPGWAFISSASSAIR